MEQKVQQRKLPKAERYNSVNKQVSMITEQQKAEIVNYLKEKREDDLPIIFGQIENDESAEKWIAAGRPRVIIEGPTDGVARAYFDQGYGWLLLWDGERFDYSSTGHEVATEKYCFVADYHGFDKGALFKRVA